MLYLFTYTRIAARRAFLRFANSLFSWFPAVPSVVRPLARHSLHTSLTKCMASAGDCNLTLLRSPILTVFLHSCAILFDKIIQNMIYGSERVSILFLHITSRRLYLISFQYRDCRTTSDVDLEYDFSKPFVPHREQCASVWNLLLFVVAVMSNT